MLEKQLTTPQNALDVASQLELEGKFVVWIETTPDEKSIIIYSEEGAIPVCKQHHQVSLQPQLLDLPQNRS